MEAATKLAPDIYAYHDYRAFLRDWVNHLKSSEPTFSLRFLARTAGFSSAYLPMVLSGRRVLSEDNLNMLLPLLRLDPTQKSYFRLLWQFRDSRSHDESVEALNKVQRFQIYRKTNPKESETYSYLAQWYHVVIRELVNIKEFQLDPKWIQAHMHFHVPVGEIARALEFLKENNFIEKASETENQWKVSQKDLECSGDVYKIVLSEFHKRMLQLTSKSIEEVSRDQRDIAGFTFPLSSQNFEKVKAILRNTMKELEQLAESETAPDVVYHVTLAGFPLSKKPGATE